MKLLNQFFTSSFFLFSYQLEVYIKQVSITKRKLTPQIHNIFPKKCWGKHSNKKSEKFEELKNGTVFSSTNYFFLRNKSIKINY